LDDIGIPRPDGWDDATSGIEGPDFWLRVLVNEVARAIRYRRALTVVVLEIEGLPDLVNMWGDEIGRHAVHEAGQCLRRASRTSDYCARIDQSRFGIVLTETDEIAAINFVERIREGMPPVLPRSGSGLRLCFGWASPMPGDAAIDLVHRAERRLVAELTR
jgi:diguanylate cyclase (GGDEF)-like protein